MIILKSMAICTKLEQINTVNVQLLIFRAKNLAGWMDGWVDGGKSRVKDCLQQLKIIQKYLGSDTMM